MEFKRLTLKELNQRAFIRRLNESIDVLNEYYHKLTDFVEFINRQTLLICRMDRYKNYDTDYIWNAKDRKCVKEPCLYDYEHEIFIKFFYSKEGEFLAFVNKTEDDENDIIININVFYLNEMKKRGKEKLKTFVKATLHHELVHIFHNFVYNHNVLGDRKNIGLNFSFDMIPESILKHINPSMLNPLKDVIYMSSKTERESRINGFCGYIESMNRHAIKQELTDFYKSINKSFNPNIITARNLIEIGDEYHGLFMYRESMEKIDFMTLVSNKIILLLGYIYEVMNLYHAKPSRITELYVLEKIDTINNNPTDDDLERINGVISFMHNMYEMYMSKVYGVADHYISVKRLNH